MRNLCKGLLVALAVAGCGIMVAPKAHAQALIQTDFTTMPAIIDSNPVVLSQPAVIDTTPVVAPTVLSAPAVINTAPVYDYDYGWGFRRNHLLDVGVPGLMNFSLF